MKVDIKVKVLLIFPSLREKCCLLYFTKESVSNSTLIATFSINDGTMVKLYYNKTY